MSAEKLAVGVYNRWNNASLNSSIATLYAAGESAKSSQNTHGSPEGTAKPRAEYMIVYPGPTNKTRGSRIHQAIVTFSVWGGDKETVGGYIESIYDAFVNSGEAGTNPLTMQGGSILEVDDGGSSNMKVDDVTYFGEQTILIRLRVANTVPA